MRTLWGARKQAARAGARRLEERAETHARAHTRTEGDKERARFATPHPRLVRTGQVRRTGAAANGPGGQRGAHGCFEHPPPPHVCSARVRVAAPWVGSGRTRGAVRACHPAPGTGSPHSQWGAKATQAPRPGSHVLFPRHGPGHQAAGALASPSETGGPPDTPDPAATPTTPWRGETQRSGKKGRASTTAAGEAANWPAPQPA